MNHNRNLTLTIGLFAVLLIAAGSWFVGSTIQSPAEAAARTAPPIPSPILVPIEERVLSTLVVTRGTARFGLPQTISIAPSALKSEVSVITTLPQRNAQLREGDVLLTASGRPLFVLQGEIPAFRDLVPGLEGPDVMQLENGLARMGFDPGPIDGVFDELTSTAVSQWYTTTSWHPFGATPDQQLDIQLLEQELADIQNQRLAAEAAALAAPLAVETAQAEAQLANLSAAAELAAASTNRAREIAQSMVLAVQLGGELAVQEAVAAQEAAQRDVQSLTDRVNTIEAELALLQFNAGVKVPSDEVVFLPFLPVRVEELAVAVGESASGNLLTVTNNQLAIDASLPLDEAPLVQPGMEVFIDEPDLGLKASGVIERVADAPGTDGVDGFHVYFETLVMESSSPLDGFSLRLTIPIETTGRLVTTVPISALSLGADGRSRIQVEKNGLFEFITVEPGLAANGFVEIQSVDAGFTPGQMVVIGFENNQ